MSDSTLSSTYDDFNKRIGSMLGMGRTAYTSLSTAQAADVDSVREAGLLRFYSQKDWVFLAPTTTMVWWATTTGTVVTQGSYSDPSTTITGTAAAFYDSMVGHSFTFDTSGTDYVIASVTSTTVIVVTGDASAETSGDTYTITAAGDGSFRLPDDFASLRGSFHFATNTGYRAPLNRSVGMIRERISLTDSTGIPQYVAIDPVVQSGVTGQRFDVVCSPAPSENFTMTYRYNMLRDALASGYRPPGTAIHHNTMIEACLAEAEAQMDDEIGIHEQRYQQFLQLSLEADARLSPANLGENGDDSGGPPGHRGVTYCYYEGELGT